MQFSIKNKYFIIAAVGGGILLFLIIVLTVLTPKNRIITQKGGQTSSQNQQSSGSSSGKTSNGAKIADLKITTSPAKSGKSLKPAQLITLAGKPAQLITLPPGQTKLTNLQIAEKVLYWLNQQKNDKGIYKYGIQCEKENNSCKEGGNSIHSSIVVIWGKFQYYKKTKNSKILKELIKDLEILTNPKIVEEVQNDFWNCKLMYDLWENDFLTQNLKNYAKQICEKGNYLADDSWNKIENALTNNETYEPNINETGYNKPTTFNFTVDLNRYDQYLSFSSDYVFRYFWFKDQKDLIRAKIHFIRALATWDLDKKQKTDPDLSKIDLSLMGITALDLYKATHNKKYLDFSSFLMYEQQKQNCVFLKSCIFYAKFIEDLSSLTKIKYKKSTNEIISTIIDSSYDLSGYPAYKKDQGVFRSFDNEFNTIYIFSVRDNALILNLLN